MSRLNYLITFAPMLPLRITNNGLDGKQETCVSGRPNSFRILFMLKGGMNA
jgi:hypothetical protein